VADYAFLSLLQQVLSVLLGLYMVSRVTCAIRRWGLTLSFGSKRSGFLPKDGDKSSFSETTPQINIVTYRPIARQRLGKHIPMEAKARNIRKSITRKRISKQAYLTIERMCFLSGPCRGAIKGQKR
jgi:hypothetical protein